MADVSGIGCWDCGEVVDDDLATICPHCGANLYAAPPVARPPVEDEGAGDGPDDAADGTAVDPVGHPADRTQGGAQAAGATRGPSARTPVLVLPDGTRVPIPDGKLEIGRECGVVAVDDALAPYVDVSRRHAVIARSGPGLFLTEIKETSFGTEVDGRRLAPFTSVPISLGARIKLGSHCYMTVEESDV